MSQQTPEPPTSVGTQLRGRREALDLTQVALAQRMGVDASTVSLTERGRTKISRGKRALWEQALQLKAGTITSAYVDGSDIEADDGAADDPPYADMSDRYERIIWSMKVSEDDRRTLIDIHRAGLAKERRARRRHIA